MRASWFLVALVAISGCVQAPTDGSDPAAEACPDPMGLWVPSGKETGPLKVDGILRSDMLAFFPNSSRTHLTAMEVPAAWRWEVEAIGPSDDNSTLIRVGVTAPGARGPTPPIQVAKGVSANWSTAAEGDCAVESGSNSWRVAAAGSGKNAAPGDGVAVYYAGFWLNGTLFSTNIADIDRSGWARGGWYAFGDDKPLNVYVYDKDRSEMTAPWSPRNPQTNQPVAWSYSPTIQGFNNAIKGLSTGSTRVVVIPPEQAYTQPGRETHALYGDSLVFYIDVVEIVDVPCPPEVTNRNACRLPA